MVLNRLFYLQNIADFGGDSNKITLMGESAGGISIDYHLHSPQEKLFNNIILQSGTSYIPGLINEGSEEGTLKLAGQLGFVTDNVSEAVSFLAKTDTSLVIAAASQINYRFLPCVEKGDSAEKFLSDYPINTDIPKVRNTPILIGNNEDEMLLAYMSGDAQYLSGLNVFYDKLNQEFDFDAEELNNLEALVRHFYIGDDTVTDEVKEGLTDFESDLKYNHPSQRSIHKYIDNGAQKIFYYIFGYNGARNFVKHRANYTGGKATHADEIGYLFDISYMRDAPSNDDQTVIDRMTTMWTNFVKYSDPTPTITDLLPVKWQPVTKDSLKYLLIDNELSLSTRPFRQRLAFWDLFFKNYTKNLRGYKHQGG